MLSGEGDGRGDFPDDEPLLPWPDDPGRRPDVEEEELLPWPDEPPPTSRRRQIDAPPMPADDPALSEAPEALLEELPPQPERPLYERKLEECDDDPTNPTLAHEAARLAYAAGCPHAAVRPLMRTAMLIAGSDPDGAIELLTRLRNMRQDTVETSQMLYDLCRARGQKADAEQALRALIRRAPDNLSALHTLLDLLLEVGRYPEAIRICERILDLDAQDALVSEKMGDACALGGDPTKAAGPWRLAADEYARRGRDEEARRLYGQVLLVAPEDAAATEAMDRLAKRR